MPRRVYCTIAVHAGVMLYRRIASSSRHHYYIDSIALLLKLRAGERLSWRTLRHVYQFRRV